jgi:hypothetical protein
VQGRSFRTIGIGVQSSMLGSRLVALPAALAVLAGGCSSVTLPSLSGSPTLESASIASGRQGAVPNAFDTTFIAEGTSTELYSLVARGAFGCWLGATGPLRATHVFDAEAAPPEKGGSAQIVLHERDPDLRDQRGPRALRITFEQAPASGVRVGFSNLRFPTVLAEAMSRDVTAWARGGAGCQTRDVHRPPLVTTGSNPSKRVNSTVSGRK